MKLSGFFAFAGGLALGLLFATIYWTSETKEDRIERMRPRVAGQKAPQEVYAISTGIKYDWHCDGFDKKPMKIEKSEIMGVTEVDDRAVKSGLFDSKYYRHDRQWIVLKKPDSRLMYIPPSIINYVEESEVKQEVNPDEQPDEGGEQGE